MKTPTLIMRIAGIYLLVICSFTLIQINASVPSDARMGGLAAMPVISYLQFYAYVGLVAGLLATCCAGRLARILTFDSGPKVPEAI
jgi:hypothetical protein